MLTTRKLSTTKRPWSTAVPIVGSLPKLTTAAKHGELNTEERVTKHPCLSVAYRRTRAAWLSLFCQERPRHSSHLLSTSIEFFSGAFTGSFAPFTSSSRSQTNASAMLALQGSHRSLPNNPKMHRARCLLTGVTSFGDQTIESSEI